MMRAVRRLPRAFVIATALQLVFVPLRFVVFGSEHSSVRDNPRWIVTSNGVWFATLALLAAGALELARRVPARQAGAARFAAAIFCSGLVLELGIRVVHYLAAFHYPNLHTHMYLLGMSAWSVLVISGFLALLIASRGFRDSRVLAWPAALAIVVARVPPHGEDALAAAIGHSATVYVTTVMGIAAVIFTMMVVARAVDQVELEDNTDLCERGLRRVAAALWLRMLISASLAVDAVRMVEARGSVVSTFHQFALVAGHVVGIAVLVGIAFGAFAAARSGVRDFSSYALHMAGALLSWVVGAMLMQLPDVLSLGASTGSFLGLLEIFPLAIPLVSAAGIVIIAIAISSFANRRGLGELRARASWLASGFVALSLVSMVLTTYGLPKVMTNGSLIAVTIGIGIATVVAAVMMAKLCTLAADAVRGARGLPIATARLPD